VAAIFLRAAADSVFFLGVLTTFRFRPPFTRTFAQRARWAAAILARAAAERRLSPAMAADSIISSVRNWSAKQDDDLTVLVCDYIRT
jgi:hypothetical protein